MRKMRISAGKEPIDGSPICCVHCCIWRVPNSHDKYRTNRRNKYPDQLLNGRKTCWPLMVTGVTVPPPVLGSCRLPPVSIVSPLDQTFGASPSLTSPHGVLASATHTIRLLRLKTTFVKNFSLIHLFCKVEPGVSGQLYALLGHQ